MRQGLFPAQRRELQRALRKADAFDRMRARTRRAFLRVGLCAVGAAGAAFWLGRWSAGRDDEPVVDSVRSRWQKKIPWAEEFARGPLEQLVAGSATFLMTIDATGGSPAMWNGYARIADWALSTQTPQSRAMIERLLQTARMAPPPPELATLITTLRAEVR
ncbi:MAG: hypothetical protein R3F56_19355 [Planctomycetota bacterium]